MRNRSEYNVKNSQFRELRGFDLKTLSLRYLTDVILTKEKEKTRRKQSSERWESLSESGMLEFEC